MSRRDVDMEHLQRLARLELDPSEAGVLLRDVASVLDYFDQLNEVDTTDVEELVRPVVPSRTWRDDLLRPSLPRELVLELVNADQDGFVQVPRTLDEE